MNPFPYTYMHTMKSKYMYPSLHVVWLLDTLNTCVSDTSIVKGLHVLHGGVSFGKTDEGLWLLLTLSKNFVLHIGGGRELENKAN